MIENAHDHGVFPGECHAAFSKLLDIAGQSGRAIYLPGGVYTCERPLVYRTQGHKPGLRLCGDGMATVLKADLSLDGSGIDSEFQSGGCLEDLKIVGSLTVRSNWHLEISKVTITGSSGDGILIVNHAAKLGDPNDFDSTCFLELNHVDVTHCAGWGLRTSVANGGGAIGPTQLRNCLIVGCQKGGVSYQGFALTVEDTSVAGCGFGVLFGFESDGAHSGSIRPQFAIRRCEIDSNAECQISVETGMGVVVEENRISAQVYPGGPLPSKTLVRMGKKEGLLVAGAKVARNIFRLTTDDPALTAVKIDKVCRNVVCENNIFPGWNKAKRYDDSGNGTIIVGDK
jgi:hypothetical protein